jgi:hypothetical protein
MLKPGQVIQVLDISTGEVITETSNPDAGLYLGKRKKSPGGFVIVYESEFRDAALLLRGHGEIPALLWNILITKVEIGTGEILVNTTEIAEMMKTHRPNISRAVKLLKSLGLIGEVRKHGKSSVYRINPRVLWKGRESERQEALRVIQGGESHGKRKTKTDNV